MYIYFLYFFVHVSKDLIQFVFFRCFKFHRRIPVGLRVSSDLRFTICMAYCHCRFEL